MVVVINKIDVSDQKTVTDLIAYWQEQLPKATIIPVSAKERFNLESVLNAVMSGLPVAPPWFDKDQFTDKNLRFFASEIIREKILEITVRRCLTAARWPWRPSRKAGTGTRSVRSST